MIYQLITSPTKEDLSEIRIWLENELNDTGEGFMNNWIVIENFFQRKQLFILINESGVIGFTTWRIVDDKCANIDIASIRPDLRYKGVGRFMMQKTFELLGAKGCVVVKLFCQPRSSEGFWKSIGFLEMPVTNYNIPYLSLFLPLIPFADSNDTGNDIIELWDCEPYRALSIPPKWSWNTELTNNKLAVPILAPCSRDWNIRWTQSGKVIRESKVKHFSPNHTLDFDEFMLIEELIDE